jgi:hypothetical protein
VDFTKKRVKPRKFTMRDRTNRRPPFWPLVVLLGLGTCTLPAVAGGKVAWLDEVVQQAVREAQVGGKAAARTETRAVGRLFASDADEGLEALVKRSDDLARTSRRLDAPAESALNSRFTRVIGQDAELTRTFSNLVPAEKRLVVEMGETAQRLARRYPGQAEPMIRKLGVEGMTAVRVYGDDVAEVIAKEGPETVGILRKTGRGGWAFLNEKVLPNKGKLAAAGVLGLFLANPEKFVDTAGRYTQYAVEQFAKAGLQLASAVGGGAAKGLETAIGSQLAAYGLNNLVLRRFGMILAGLVVFGAVMIILGMPMKWMLKPVVWPLKMLMGRKTAKVT